MAQHTTAGPSEGTAPAPTQTDAGSRRSLHRAQQDLIRGYPVDEMMGRLSFAAPSISC
jgi:hypothetical protein